MLITEINEDGEWELAELDGEEESQQLDQLTEMLLTGNKGTSSKNDPNISATSTLGVVV
jgi:hypothetical protein